MKGNYPKTYIMRYMGSKLKILESIIPKLESMVSEGDTVLDLMAGTHAIGYALKPRHPIITNDIQEYSKVIGVGRIENNSVSLTEKDLEKDIVVHLNKNKKYNLFTNNYSDTYFSKKQCIEIDNLRYAIEQVHNPTKKSLYLTALVYAMGYCQSSAGHFAQFMPKDHPRVKTLRELSIFDAFKKKVIENHVVFSKFKNKVFKKDYRELLTNESIEKNLKKVKLVYIDPPYSEAQYSRFYHLLETAVKYDYPKLEHKGLYRNDRFQSNFCYKGKVEKEFDFIASKTAKMKAKLAISYSETGLLTTGAIKKICRKYFKKVRILSFKHSHSMQGRGMILGLKEVLITAEN
jgi:adenine-specific DNA-methyltransferase